LAHIDSLTATIEELTGEIQTQIAPFQHTRKRLTTIPGVSDRLAENLIAETGADMSRFPTPQQLASWAGMCPGNNESAGKHFSGRTRKAIGGCGERWERPRPPPPAPSTRICRHGIDGSPAGAARNVPKSLSDTTS
jgi:Transposase IS116/IS110/IS902 family